MQEPLTRSLVSVTKKYLSAFSELTRDLELERYQLVLLRIEEHEEKLTQKGLSEVLQIDKSSVVNIVDYLSEHGYVYREKNERDRREQIIRFTEKGKSCLPVIRNAIRELNQLSLHSVSEQQLNTFQEVLETIQNNLRHSSPSSIFIDFKKVAVK